MAFKGDKNVQDMRLPVGNEEKHQEGQGKIKQGQRQEKVIPVYAFQITITIISA